MMVHMPNEAPIATADVAAILGKSTRTVQRLAETGELPYVQKIPGGSNGIYLFDPAVVRKYLADQAAAASA
jgi:phage terminase Nu1 subunit (DNA packaging protein)